METLHHRNVHGVQKYCSDISLSAFLSIIEVDFLTSRNLKSWRGGGPRGPRGSCTYACTCMEIYARFVNCVELFSLCFNFFHFRYETSITAEPPPEYFPHAVEWTAEGSVFSAVTQWVFSLITKYLGIREPLNRFAPNSHGRRVLSLARMSLKVKVKGHQRQKTAFSALSAACVRFMFGKNIFSLQFKHFLELHIWLIAFAKIYLYLLTAAWMEHVHRLCEHKLTAS